MATAVSEEHPTALREVFKAMDPRKAQEIREAYYEAITSLKTLADTLELADLAAEQSAGPLITEHLIAIAALDAMAASRLGAVL